MCCTMKTMYIYHINYTIQELMDSRYNNASWELNWSLHFGREANIQWCIIYYGRAYIARSWCNDVIQTFPNNRRIVPNALWRFSHSGNGSERTEVSRVLSKCGEVQLNSVKNFSKSNCTSVGTYVQMKSILSSLLQSVITSIECCIKWETS